MASRVALVSCVKTKQALPARAEDLYISELFKCMRRYAERNADAWFILSAQYGLVRPDQVIEPYERTLNTMRKQERLVWAAKVNQQLLELLPPTAGVMVLAGERYREFIVPFLSAKGFSVHVPMEGLAFGPQLRWLKMRAQEQ